MRPQLASCPVCGHVSHGRWRNQRRPLRLEHIAGDVVDVYGPPPPGRARGRTVVDRIQSCARCGRELARGRRGLFYAPGDRVIEHGADRPAPLLCLPHDDDPAQPCS